MKTVFEHIEHVKGKPHHIRKKVALTAATVITAVIALIWLVGSLSVGTFALKESSFADATRAIDVPNTADSASNLAGAAAVLNDETPVRIEIVDTSPPRQKKPEPTVIPF